MDEAEKKRMEAMGYWVGDYAEFLGLTEAERQHVELRGLLSKAVKRAREARGLTPRALAKRIGATTSQVAKIETGTVAVSLDLMFNAYFEVGGKLEDLANGQAHPEAAPGVTSPAEPEAPAAKPKPRKRLARSG